MKIIRRIYLFFVFLFLYGPIITMAVFSFNNSRIKQSWSGFTLNWYIELFHNEEILNAFYVTIIVAIITTIIATILGTMASIGIYYMPKLRKKVLLNINYIPVLNPDIVTAISLMVIFKLIRMDFGYMTLLLSHITFTTPYVILSVLPKLKQMPKSLPEAAMDLGADPFFTFRKIIIPECRSGIISGALLAFTLSLDDFVISFFNIGNGVSTISTTVYSMAKKGINPAINALSTIMFISIIILLLVINKRSNIIEEEV
ncbi:MAG: ABC transporter permease [Tissierellia bacterium]|nr:ABC transporter permease [Tissierellia bacterium]